MKRILITLITCLVSVMAYVVLIVAYPSLLRLLATDQNMNIISHEVMELNDEMTLSVDNDAVQFASVNTQNPRAFVDIFEDYSDPHAMKAGIHNDRTMFKHAFDGDIVVRIHPIITPYNRFSLLAAEASHLIAQQGDFDTWWNFRNALVHITPSHRNNITSSKLADIADMTGADADTVRRIASRNYPFDMRALGNSAHMALQDYMGEESYDFTVVVNEKPLSYDQATHYATILDDMLKQ